MNETIINHGGKKVLKRTEKNKKVIYVARGIYLGKDVKTNKQVTTSITANSLKELDRKCFLAKEEFKINNSTKKTGPKLVNFKELALEWFEDYKRWVESENTLNRVFGYLKNYIIPKFGDYYPNEIDSKDIQSWVNNLADRAKCSANSGTKKSKKGFTQNYSPIVNKLKEIFDFGKTYYELSNNPVDSIKIPPKPKSAENQIKVLHDDELKQWLIYLNSLRNTRANRRFKTICSTLLATGLRISELLALEVSDIDFKNQKINVNKTIMWHQGNKELHIKGKMICKKTPKTASSNRQVATPIEILENLLAFHNEMNDYFLDHGLPITNLIFPTINGTYICDRNERASLEKHLENAKLPVYGFHLFRHTYASIMLNSDVNYKLLQTQLGHKDITMTLNTYASVAPNKFNKVVEIFTKKLSELEQ